MKRGERKNADSQGARARETSSHLQSWNELITADTKLHAAAVILGLTLAIAFIYAPVRNFDFVNLDDYEYVPQNPHVTSGLSAENIRWALTTGYAANWFPLTWMSLMLDVELFGVDSGWLHLVNVSHHIASSILLFLILFIMTGSLWRSAFAAAVFALHPLRVESVAWVTERKDTLSTLFWMLTLGAYVLYVRKPGVARYAVMLVCFMLGLMSKPMLVTMPFVLLLFDVWPLRRISPQVEPGLRDLRRVMLEKLPMLLMVIASSAITYHVQSLGGSVSMTGDYPVSLRLANGVVGYVRYIGKLIWPLDLAVFYPFNEAIPAWQVLGAAALLAGISIAVLLGVKRRPELSVGWFLYLGTMVPVIGLVKIGSHSIADRYTYIPHIGLLLIIAWGLPGMLTRCGVPRKALPVLAVVCLLTLTALSRAQTASWQNSMTMWSHAARVVENNAEAHSQMAVILADQGKWEEANREFETALRMSPKLVHAQSYYGAALLRQGRVDQAIEYLRQAVRANPHLSDAESNLGAALAAKGDLDQAVRHYQNALRTNPASADAITNWGIALASRGDLAGAIGKFEEALRLKPDSPDAHNNLGAALARSGKIPEASARLREAVRLKPDQPDWLVNLAVLLIQQNERAEAGQLVQRALLIAPQHPRALALKESLASAAP